jgi:hypothetical protein
MLLSAVQLVKTPVASSPARGSACGKPGLGFCGDGGSVPTSLMFRGAEDYYSHNPNEISLLSAELVFREVPGEWVQRRRQSHGFRRLRLLRCTPVNPPGDGIMFTPAGPVGRGQRCTPVNPPGDGIARVPAAPVCLRLLSAGSLTLRLAASPLTVSYSRIRPEPLATDRAWSAA